MDIRQSHKEETTDKYTKCIYCEVYKIFWQKGIGCFGLMEDKKRMLSDEQIIEMIQERNHRIEDIENRIKELQKSVYRLFNPEE